MLLNATHCKLLDVLTMFRFDWKWFCRVFGSCCSRALVSLLCCLSAINRVSPIYLNTPFYVLHMILVGFFVHTRSLSLSLCLSPCFRCASVRHACVRVFPDKLAAATACLQVPCVYALLFRRCVPIQYGRLYWGRTHPLCGRRAVVVCVCARARTVSLYCILAHTAHAIRLVQCEANCVYLIRGLQLE